MQIDSSIEARFGDLAQARVLSSTCIFSMRMANWSTSVDQPTCFRAHRRADRTGGETA
jgi:hypothetical protein